MARANSNRVVVSDLECSLACLGQVVGRGIIFEYASGHTQRIPETDINISIHRNYLVWVCSPLFCALNLTIKWAFLTQIFPGLTNNKFPLKFEELSTGQDHE